MIDVVLFYKKYGVDQLLGEFVTIKHYILFPLHNIAEKLGPERVLTLLFLHAFSGCDAISSFVNIDKKTVWETWAMMTHITVLVNLAPWKM